MDVGIAIVLSLAVGAVAGYFMGKRKGTSTVKAGDKGKGGGVTPGDYNKEINDKLKEEHLG